MRVARDHIIHTWKRFGRLALVAVLLGCSTSGEPVKTPERPVYAELYLQATPYQVLLSPGGMLRLTTPTTSMEQLGFGGLLVVHGLKPGFYYAYDLSCPVENSPLVRIELQGLDIKCPTCGTSYDALGGTGAPISGIGRSPLRPYHASYNPTQYLLSIRN